MEAIRKNIIVDMIPSCSITHLQWALLNMLTSLIFAKLSTNEEIRKQAIASHWRFSPYDRKRHQSQQLVAAYDIKYEWPDIDLPTKTKSKRRRAKKKVATQVSKIPVATIS